MTTENVILTVILIVSSYVGYKVINRVPSLLHTPLMSGMNAFSGITLLGCMTIVPTVITSLNYLARIMALVAIVLATVNIVAGFAVTDRMLKMFKRGGK